MIPKIFGVPRSGSTVIFNIVNYLYGGLVLPQKHNYFSDGPGLKTIVTYRDFRDSCVSQWRAFYGNFDEEEDKKNISNLMLQKHVADQLNTINFLDKFKADYDSDQRDVLFLRYEDFFSDIEQDLNFDFLFHKFEKFLEINISTEQRTFIQKEFCFKNQKNKSKKFKNFHEYNQETHLHGHHLYKGKTGSWKEMVPEKNHSFVDEVLGKHLIRWGYKL